jgi:hypothetical protein
VLSAYFDAQLLRCTDCKTSAENIDMTYREVFSIMKDDTPYTIQQALEFGETMELVHPLDTEHEYSQRYGAEAAADVIKAISDASYLPADTSVTIKIPNSVVTMDQGI